MEHLLSDLLYYDISTAKNAALQKGLKEYQVLLAALEEAILALENGDLEKFDSLVGENACQIRAIRIASIHTHNLTFSKGICDRIFEVQSKIQELLAPKKIATLMRDGVSLKEVSEENQLSVVLSDDEMFALKAYLLTEMKEELSSDEVVSSLLRQERSMPVKIKRFDTDISYTFTNRLASLLRQRLAKASVDYVRESAEDLNDFSLMQMVSEEYTIEHNALKCIPMFWTYQILLKTAQKERIPIVVRVKFVRQEGAGYRIKNEKTFFFSPVSDGKSAFYEQSVPSEADWEKAACVFQGVACNTTDLWDESVILNSVTDAILAGAADHRQYPNPDLGFSVNDQEYEKFKTMALNRGFSSHNPSTFFIQHVYPAQVKKCLSA